MRIKTKKLDYDKVLTLKRPEHQKPLKPNFLLSSLIRILSVFDLHATKFSFTEKRMEAIKGKPCLILMNHSCFLDLEIAFRIFYPRRMGVVCTSDGFIGKKTLMRMIGCIPTQKFVSDVTLITDMLYLLKEKNTSVLMYPEASYSFDGTATALPRKFGVLIKKLNVPVVMVTTKGAFLRDPLYNMLQKRRVKVSAHAECILTPEEIKSKSTKEIDEILNKLFSFDSFKWQKENNVEINESFRADGLHRILYKCSECKTEGKMVGEGIFLTCRECGEKWELTPLGELKSASGKTTFSHIPDWYKWERACVREELENEKYNLKTDVKIGMMVDYKAIYNVGEGTLIHNSDGFTLTGCNNRLNYEQGPLSSYGLYADYYWYQISDVICIGNKDALYYCFPKDDIPVAKARMASEELYKLIREKKRRKSKTEADI
ncbi:MAG: 1-acyl-sn-glycerol-3-phosphate acyltransferase [Clostridia bacterium]|nr:1-acyl-sn-glycerol-3-phosphate acyltransferase [Clostridia bacterium]